MSYTKHTLLIDGNAIGYSAQQATRLNSGGMETQAAFGMLKAVRELRNKYPKYSQLVLWDGRSQWRYDLYPGYKGNRNSTPEKLEMKEHYAKQKPYIKRALTHLGIPQMTAGTHEADDLAGMLVAKFSSDSLHSIGLITGDQDWIQMVRRNVFWRDIRDDTRIVNAENFYSFTGCKTPMQFIERKCLMGDTSDTITGVGGIGAAGAPVFIAEHGSVRDFWRKCDSGLHTPANLAELRLWKGECEHDKEAWTALYGGDPTDTKALKAYIAKWPGQGKSLFRRNFRLMQLLKVDPPRKEDIEYLPGKFDQEAFSDVCSELAFMSIVNNIDDFTRQFKG